MGIRTTTSCFLFLLLITFVARAEQILFYDDFQDGNAEGWVAGGNGDTAVNNYEGSITLRLTDTAYAIAKVPIAGAGHIRVGAAFAARDLEASDVCLAQFSLDEGATWVTVVRVGDGQDDGLSMHSGAMSQDVPEGLDSILVLARSAANAADDTCWLDNVSVIGDQGSPGKASITRMLTGDFLLGDAELRNPVSMSEYTMPDAASEPQHVFSGSLRLLDTDQAGEFEVVEDDWDRVGNIGTPIHHLPEFDFEFVQRGHDILPLQQGLQRRNHPYWEVILQPGKAWNENADGEWTRASVPFSLQERSANCTHNGVLTWLFSSDNQVSRVAYQISSETCGYFKFDMWGVVDAEYQQQDLAARAAAIVTRFDVHAESRLPVRTLAQLGEDYPGVDPYSFGVDDGINPADMTVLGLVVDGVNYRGDCHTRAGPYPYCASVPLPSYSTAKSIFAGIATMRLETLYPGTSKTSIASLIDECDRKQWRDVTIENALDMATGNYRSTKSSEDEDSAQHIKFVFDDTHEEKLEFACNYFKRKAEPGTQFVYHTSDTYLVGAALGEVLADKDNGADLYQSVLVEPIWRALNLSPLLDDTKRTYDSAAQAFVGYGLTYEVDDIVRIAEWLHHGGQLGAESLLDEKMLAASMQRSPEDRGLEAGSANLKYNNGFWAFNAGPSLGCAESVWVPFMSGVSGITVAMFPNGVIYYYFSDSRLFRWQSGRDAAHRIRSMCP